LDKKTFTQCLNCGNTKKNRNSKLRPFKFSICAIHSGLPCGDSGSSHSKKKAAFAPSTIESLGAPSTPQPETPAEENKGTENRGIGADGRIVAVGGKLERNLRYDLQGTSQQV